MIAPAPRAVRSIRPARILAAACLALVAPVTFLWAGAAFDVSVGLPLGDDARLFLNVTNEYYAPPQEVATAIVRGCPHPEDDFPAVLLLARACGRPPGEILEMRLQGRSWADVMFAFHVSPSVLFVGIDRDPGPPYGKAWGYWRRHPHGRLVVEDREFVELAKVRVASAYYHVPPARVIAERRRGVAVERYAAERHRERERRRLEKRDERRDRGRDRKEGGAEDRGRKGKEHGGHGHPHDEGEHGNPHDGDR